MLSAPARPIETTVGLNSSLSNQHRTQNNVRQRMPQSRITNLPPPNNPVFGSSASYSHHPDSSNISSPRQKRANSVQLPGKYVNPNDKITLVSDGKKNKNVHVVSQDNFRIQYYSQLLNMKKKPAMIVPKMTEQKKSTNIPIAQQVARVDFDWNSDADTDSLKSFTPITPNQDEAVFEFED